MLLNGRMRNSRTVTIIAQDPSVRVRNRILTAQVALSCEPLAPGPRSHRAHVIDYDGTTRTLYAPQPDPNTDQFAGAPDRELLTNPHFHAQNVHAIVMRTLTRFEQALGRHVPWSFGGHQIKIAPHAFAEANALYSKHNEALLFGYFRSAKSRGHVFTCLSHDVVAHETAHALLDGIRPHYAEPSGPDQAALHEAFADIAALLCVFSLPEMVEVALPKRSTSSRWRLRSTLLLRIAKQVGNEAERKCALRLPIELRPSRTLLQQREFQSPHRRGEVLVAALLNAFVDIWERRVYSLGNPSRPRVIEEGATIAEQLLTTVIRALDYCPPVDITFDDYLSAILTADFEESPDDTKLGLRRSIRVHCGKFGIGPTASSWPEREQGLWSPFIGDVCYRNTHFDALQRDPEEIFRFLWHNRRELGIAEESHLRVNAVHSCLRQSADGFSRRETVSSYIETLRISAGELAWMSPAIAKPAEMPDSQSVTLYGGGTLIFDEQGTLRYHIRNSLRDRARQSARLDYLWRSGFFETFS